MRKITIPAEAALTPLHRYLEQTGNLISMPCGGNGRCGKCLVKAESGVFLSGDGVTPLKPDNNGMIPACRALCPREGGVISVPAFTGNGLADYTSDSNPAGRPGHGAVSPAVSLDIGTTTLAMRLIDRNTGASLGQVSALNPQQAYGSDVMTRIDGCRKGLLGEMRDALLSSVRGMTAELEEKTGLSAAGIPAAAAGNTVMLHVFLGVSPEGMAASPFTPAFTASRTVSGSSLGLPFGTVTTLPCASAFIGGDITAGLFASGIARSYLSGSSENILFADLGTNGEMILLSGGRLTGASAAAGPALEGGNISCGTGGVPGAVSSCTDKNGVPVFTTVGDEEPSGICSAGLVDILARLLDKGIMDETGYMEDESFRLAGLQRFADGSEKPCAPPLSVTGRDIREFQLAKSAIRAGMETLLSEAGIGAEDLGAVCLAGGLGYYMNTASACRLGLFPPCSQDKIRVIGNGALGGAEMLLTGNCVPDDCEKVAREIRTVELNSSAFFSSRFIENMYF